MTMWRICTSNVSCDSAEIVSDLHYLHYVAPLVASLVYPSTHVVLYYALEAPLVTSVSICSLPHVT